MPVFPPVTRYTRPVRSGRLSGVQAMTSRVDVKSQLAFCTLPEKNAPVQEVIVSLRANSSHHYESQLAYNW
jgi:hypothetical protein